MDKNRVIEISAKIALVFAIVCSTAYLLMLGWYNNLLLDDYGFVADVDRDGAWGLMSHAYLYWQARFSAFYVLGGIFKIWGHASNLIGYTILLLIIGYAIIYYALRRITKIQNKWLILGEAMLINNVSIMAYMELSTFYWVCCALYTLSTYAAILLFTVIFFSHGKEWFRWTIVILCSLYLCGGAENFTPLVIAAFGCILLYQMISQRTWHFWQTKEQKMCVVSLLILCIGFLIVIKGPGTSYRVETINSGGFMAHFAVIPYLSKLVSSFSIFMLRILSRGLYYILLIPFGILIGLKMSNSFHVERVWKPILITVGIALGIVLLSIAASVFGMGWYAPLRAYSFVSYVLSAMVIYIAAIIGTKLYSVSRIQLGILISSLFIVSMCCVFIQKERPMVSEYHNRIDSCHTMIINQIMEDRKEPLEVAQIPCPYMPNTYAIMRVGIGKIIGNNVNSVAAPATYFPYEQFSLSVEPSDWRNVGLQKYFDANFSIIGWSASE